jgi:uncharacterized protein involved in exopolysaccharide biosynthesis
MIDQDQSEQSSSRERIEARIAQRLRAIAPHVKRLWRARWKLLKVNGIVAIAYAIVLFFSPGKNYVSAITILPEYGNKQSMLGSLGDLAALAGLSIGDNAPTSIYQNLLRSEAVISPVIYEKYKTEAFSDSVDLREYFKLEMETAVRPEQRERLRFLRFYKVLTERLIETDIDRETKILTVNVTMPESQLSADVANKLAASLDEYIRTRRKSYASAQRRYIEQRISQVSDSLTLAEDQLKHFRQKNRVIEQSPDLLLNQTRLMRNVDIMQTVFAQLMGQLELVKIDEIRDTPVLNIKELARDPVVPLGPSRRSKLMVIVLLSVLLTGVYFIYEFDIKSYAKGLRNQLKALVK